MLQNMKPKDWEKTYVNSSVGGMNVAIRGMAACIFLGFLVYLTLYPLTHYLGYGFQGKLLFLIFVYALSQLCTFLVQYFASG